jgi:dTDP-4-amino-4,6-dideoxygalactose transaminase
VNNRDELIEKLKKKGISASVHFIPVHKHPYYKKTYGYKEKDYPISNKVFEKSLSLPIYPDLKDEEIEYIIKSVSAYAK